MRSIGRVLSSAAGIKGSVGAILWAMFGCDKVHCHGALVRLQCGPEAKSFFKGADSHRSRGGELHGSWGTA